MASFKQYTASGGASEAFSIPTFSSDEIKVYVAGALKTAATHYNITSYTANGGTVTWTTGNVPNGVVVRIVRDTGVTTARATYAAGSSIKADDLNDNQTQVLRSLEEQDDQLIQTYDIQDSAITTAKIKADNITSALIADDQINSEHYVDGSIDTAHIADSQVTTAKIADANVTTAKIAADAITGAKIADNSIDSEHYVDGSIDTVHLADSSVTGAKLAAGTIGTSDLADSAVTTAKIADNSITSQKIVEGTIASGDLGANCILTAKIEDNAVTGAKIADNSITSQKIVEGTIASGDLGANSILTAKIENAAVTGAKIANDAIDSQHYAADSIDTEHYAAGSVDTTALGANSVTTAKIADDAVIGSKIQANSIDASHLVADCINTSELNVNCVVTENIADNSITSQKIVEGTIASGDLGANSILTSKIEDGAVTTAKIAADAVTGAKIADNAIGAEHIAANAVTTSEIADAELTTLAGMQSGTASILAAGTTLTATLAEINTVVDGKSVETTISNTDAAYPTSGAVVDYVAAQIAPIGGLEVIANDASFPNTQPQAGVVISIADAGGLVVNGSGSSTTARTVGGSTVTINSINSSYNSSTVTDGVGFLVSSTGSGQIYNFHKSVIRDQDILSISSDINDFANRYRVASSAPTSSKDDGDLWFDTANGKMMVYNDNNTAWEEVSAIGNFNINTISSSGNTGGGSSTFNGTAYRFVLSNPPQDAQQLLVSINGVIQKPNAGTSQPSEGFAISGNDIIFSAAPPSGSDYFITTLGESVQIGTPSDNTISTAKIQNLAVTTAKIANDAVTGDKIATNLDLPDNNKIRFGTGNDTHIYHNGVHTYISHRGTGDLILEPKEGENGLILKTDAAVELYYNGARKFRTYANGAVVDGHLLLDDNNKLLVGTGSDLQIYHDGSNSYVAETGTGDLVLQGGAIWLQHGNGENALKATEDAGVELRYNNVKKFETNSTGVSVTGQVNSGTMHLTDGNGIHIGNSNDLQIYHNGSNSYVSNTTGDLYIRSDANIRLTNTSNESILVGNAGGACELRYDDVKKFETTSAGAQVTGNLRVDGLLDLYDDKYIRLGDSADLQIYHNGSNSKIDNTTGTLYIQGDVITLSGAGGSENLAVFTKNGNVELYYDNVRKFRTTAEGAIVDGSLYLGDSKHIILNDTNKAKFGNDEDLQIYHDGTHSYITNTTGDLKITDVSSMILASNSLRLKTGGASETYLGADVNAAVELYYDNVKKFETLANGVQTSGSHFVMDGDGANGNPKFACGNGADLNIYHTGSISHIDVATAGQGLKIRNNYSSGNMIDTLDFGDQGRLYNNCTDTSHASLTLRKATAADGLDYLQCRSGDNTLKMRVEGDGDVANANNSYGSTSDVKLKENIVDANSQWNDIKAVKVRNFNFKASTGLPTDKHIGVVAQEIETVSAGLVSESIDRDPDTGEDLGTKTKQVKYSVLYMKAIKALQEAMAKIETLETKVAALEAK